MRERLKRETEIAHRQLEVTSKSHRIMDGSLTRRDYREIIDWQARAHRVLEPLIDIATPGYSYRARTPVLPEVTKPNIDPGLPPGLATSLGLAYVLEGGSLGGAMILRQLQRNPNLKGLDFPFYGHQASSGIPQWRAYLAYLEKLDLTAEQQDAVIHAANRGFEVFRLLW